MTNKKKTEYIQEVVEEINRKLVRYLQPSQADWLVQKLSEAMGWERERLMNIIREWHDKGFEMQTLIEYLEAEGSVPDDIKEIIDDE